MGQPNPWTINSGSLVSVGARIYRSISAADAGAQQQTRRPPLLLSAVDR